MKFQGPCQFPTLGFVVDRFRKVQSFIPEKFWSITLEVTRNGLRAVFGWSRNHLFNRHIVLALYELCMKNPVCTISKVEAKPKSKWAPLPLTTVELQKVGSRFLHMGSDRVMQVAEALYNRGIVSYPRTETDCFDDKFDLMPLIEKQTQSQEWGSYAASLLNGKFTKPRKGKNNDQAHPPIHPVRAAFDLSGDEKKVFDYITRRFLACCSAAARGQETVVDLELSQEKFTSSGLMILERNYLEVFPYEKWSDSDIPTFSVGERVEPSLLEMREGSTTRPTMLTEADLITLMDKSGIGTDATIHEHIKKILDREYARKENIYFFPTTLGMALVTAYDEMDIDLSLSRPFLRSLTEANMKKICDGARQREDVVSESIELYKNVFIAAFGQASKLHESCAKFFGHAPDATPQRADRFNDVAIRNCPKCRLPMTLRVLPNNTKMIGCSGYPACREVLFLPSFVTNVAKSENTCSTCGNATEPTSKLQLSFRPHSVPPTIPLEYDTCVWCDDQLLELFSFERGRNRAPPQQQSGSTISENIHNYPPPPPPSAGAAAITTSFSSTPLTQISPPRYNAPQHHPLQTNQRNPTFNSVDEDAQMCLCLMPLLELTVRKEGPNQGRIFLSCPKPKDDPTRCHIFQASLCIINLFVCW
ncbi:DNA topoisomerase [Batrachochytrium dendrobatidis]